MLSVTDQDEPDVHNVILRSQLFQLSMMRYLQSSCSRGKFAT
ncbi:hypothetical protein MITSMUL_04667 [Mitsuokella multacida DSM 20544]|uniref:Uncharacterized protein n=1 Tax=Mitsuokella multacida DSM 20544 TaxID=500635 RepID=C9KNH7_9FIRM|nr:hypothetical protein MITSMUL_04667 [Mitsuokella multacida DSM 20544]